MMDSMSSCNHPYITNARKGLSFPVYNYLIFHLWAGKTEFSSFFCTVKRYTLEYKLEDNLGFKWLYSII
ncbi:photosystem II protein D2 [Iris pallida]|uniref:Photosystem II protein D2 (Plastid) n=1 Tax=Iris pallida TaxID=29817 RepID=A0AAX6DI76_IRIPA|nr:photosystem II protein D2 [Iris pallida]